MAEDLCRACLYPQHVSGEECEAKKTMNGGRPCRKCKFYHARFLCGLDDVLKFDKVLKLVSCAASSDTGAADIGSGALLMCQNIPVNKNN